MISTYEEYKNNLWKFVQEKTFSLINSLVA